MVLNPFTYTIFQSSSNHQERTDSRRGLNTDETRLKSPLEGEREGGGGGGVSVYFLLSLYPTASLLVSVNNQSQAAGCRMDVELLVFHARPSLLCRRSVTRNVDLDKLDLCYCLSRYWGA